MRTLGSFTALVFLVTMSPATHAQGAAADEALSHAIEAAASSYDVLWCASPRLPAPAGAWIASNPAHAFRAVFQPEGVSVQGDSDGDRWSFALSLERWGRGDALREVGPAQFASAGARVEYRREDLVEWYQNDASGLEQGFDVLAPPLAARACGPLELQLRVAGDARVDAAANSHCAFVRDECGRALLAYADLRAWDASGARLDARLRVAGERLTISIDDSSAVYPVTVDPSIASLEAKLVPAGNRPGERAGFHVDVDGDTAAVLATASTHGPWVCYVFERSGTAWTQSLRLADPFQTNTTAADVDLEGDLLLVGFTAFPASSDQGAVDIFERTGTGWAFAQQLGNNTSFNAFGDDVDVVAPDCVTVCDDSHGGTKIYRKQLSGLWTQETDLFGSMTVTGRGDLVVEGTPVGGVVPHRFDGVSWNSQGGILTLNPFETHPLAIDEEEEIAVGDPMDDDAGANAGAVYLLRRDGAGWVLHEKLLSPDFPSSAGFGEALDFEGGTLAVGCPNDDTAAVNAGAVYLFRRNGGWTEEPRLVAPDASAVDGFGRSVSLDQDTLLVGAWLDDNASGTDAGSAYVFTLAHDAEVYCTAKVNSLGCLPEIDFVGTPSASSASPFVISARKVLSNKLGVFYYGISGRAAFPFDGGTQCVAGSVRRTGMNSSGGNFPPTDCSGVQSIDFNARIQSGVDPNLVAGAQVNGQFWTRDGGVASGTGLSDGIEFVVQP